MAVSPATRSCVESYPYIFARAGLTLRYWPEGVVWKIPSIAFSKMLRYISSVLNSLIEPPKSGERMPCRGPNVWCISHEISDFSMASLDYLGNLVTVTGAGFYLVKVAP